MSDKKIILVTGSTSLHGSSVARHLLNSEKYVVRCLVKESQKEKANQFAALGAQIMTENLLNRESIRKAMQNVYGVYANVDFWEAPTKPEIEIQQGINLADIAKECNISHYVYASSVSPKQLTNGKLTVPQMDGKAEIAKHCRDIGLPLTEIQIPFCMENFLGVEKPSVLTMVTYSFPTFPMRDKPLDMISAEDIGGVVVKIFDDPDRWIGKTIAIASDSLNGNQIAEIFSQHTGKKAMYKPMSIDDYKRSAIPHAEKRANQVC